MAVLTYPKNEEWRIKEEELLSSEVFRKWKKSKQPVLAPFFIFEFTG